MRRVRVSLFDFVLKSLIPCLLVMSLPLSWRSRSVKRGRYFTPTRVPPVYITRM